MATGKVRTPGIRASGKGIRVTVYRAGKVCYDKTIPGDYYSKADLRAATRHRDKLVARVRLGQPLFDADETATTGQLFEYVAQRYLNTIPVGGYRDNARYHLQCHWIKKLQGRPVNEITRTEIRDHTATLPLKSTSKRNVLASLRAVFDYAEVMPNPVYKIKLAKEPSPTVDRYTPQERDAILGKLEGQARVYFALLFATGLRPGEARALTWADYDGQYLHISKQWTRRKFKDHTKTMAERRVFVPEWVRPILQAHVTRLAGGNIFLQRKDQPVRDSKTLNKRWVEAHQKARIGANPVRYRRPYTTRHTRASELLSMGVSPAEAAHELGHSVQMFLGIYARFMDEFASRDMSRFQGVAMKEQA